MGDYLIPANAKKGKLILNVFRLFDLILFGSGFLITIILLLAIKDNGLWITVIKMLPVAITGFLVMPVPFYHNVLEFLKDAYIFITSQNKYTWRGWCASYVTEQEQQSKN